MFYLRHLALVKGAGPAGQPIRVQKYYCTTVSSPVFYIELTYTTVKYGQQRPFCTTTVRRDFDIFRSPEMSIVLPS